MSENKAEEKRFIIDTRAVLQSREVKQILQKLKELKARGRVGILPDVLDLLTGNEEEEDIKSEVFSLLCDLKEQACTPVVIDYIENHDLGENLAGVLAACWQSRLDYSSYLHVFVKCFVKGTYQESLEAFTVIEEMLWRAKEETILSCKQQLKDSISLISKEKQPLYRELVKTLEEGESPNQQFYPDIYDR